MEPLTESYSNRMKWKRKVLFDDKRSMSWSFNAAVLT